MRPSSCNGAQRLVESVSPILHSIAIRLRDLWSLADYASPECMTMCDTCSKAHQALTLFGASVPPGQRRSKIPLMCLAESFGVRTKLLARSTCVTPKRGPYPAFLSRQFHAHVRASTVCQECYPYHSRLLRFSFSSLDHHRGHYSL